MTILYNDLVSGDGITTTIRLTRDLRLYGVKCHLVIHGTLTDGSVQVEVSQSGSVLATSSLTYEQLNDSKVEDYKHGYYLFNTDTVVLRHDSSQDYTEYTIKVYAPGMTMDESKYVSLVYEHLKNDIYDSTSVLSTGIELYTI